MTYEVETILLAVALMTAAVAIGWLSLALRKSVRRGGDPGALPNKLSDEAGLASDGFAGRRARLGNDLIGAAADLPAEDRDRVHHALWHAMLLEAAADGNADPKEVRFVAEFFAHLSGRKLPGDSAMEAADDIAAHPQRALAEITKAREAAAASRRWILESAMLVSLSGGEPIQSDANRLDDIAGALGFGLDERRAIYAGMTNRLRN